MKPSERGLPITLGLEGERVVLVGAGEEAEAKRALLVEAGADLRVVSSGCRETELTGARLVLYLERDAKEAARLHAVTGREGALFWAIDDPIHSDLALPAIARLGAAQLAISTSGKSPALASLLRATFEQALDGRFATFVDALGALRVRVRSETSDPVERRTRLRAALDELRVWIEIDYPDWFTKGIG